MMNLFIEFRRMIDNAISVGIEKNLTSKFKLSEELFGQFGKKYRLHSWYRLSAFDMAIASLKNYRKQIRKNGPLARKPYVSRLFASIGNQGYRVENGVLSIPIEPKRFIRIPLNRHTLKVLSANPNISLGSITLTENSVSIAIRKECEVTSSTGYLGIDRNLNNATIALSDGSFERFDTSEITAMKEKYSDVKSHLVRNDQRIRKKVFSKYGNLQSRKESQRLHIISKKVCERAKQLKFGIVMENIKGIRKLYRKGNYKSQKYRRRLNSWSFYKLQKMIEYKAKWGGIPVIYVSPKKTSSICAICGEKIIECAERKVWCSKCKYLVDRDINAARNILARGLRFKPIGPSNEAMKGNQITKPVILQADGDQLTLSRA